MMKKIIGYMRVSTKVQGDSGLGLQAQKQAILNHVDRTDSEVVEMLTEVESGTKGHRPVLTEAISLCKKHKATLVVSKLDRLYRNLYFVTKLMESKIDFVALDLPDASPLTIHIFAALAEHEARLTSERTKAALEQKKKQGHKLGKPENFSSAARKKGRDTISRNAANNSDNRKATAMITALTDTGCTFRSIAKKLNESGYRTVNGCLYTPTQVSRLYNRSFLTNQ